MPNLILNNLGRTVGLIFLMALLLSAGNAWAGVSRKMSYEGDRMVLTYTFAEPTIESTGAGSKIEIQDLPRTNYRGLPSLPVFGARILIPWDKRVSGVRVIPGDSREIEITAVPRTGAGAFRRNIGKGDLPPSDPDGIGRAAIWPDLTFRQPSVQVKRGLKMLRLNLFPVQYLPGTNTILFHPELAVEITLEAEADPMAYLPTSGLRAQIPGQVDNPDIMAGYKKGRAGKESGTTVDWHYLSDPDSDTVQYLVITGADLADTGNYTDADLTFQGLCDVRQQQGLTAGIVTTETIYDSFGGDDRQAMIRRFLRFAYENYETEFVLLGGNEKIVPVRMFYDTDEFIPSDLYYACVDPWDNTFDGDGDGRFGEAGDGPDGGDVDLSAELLVGRAGAESASEVSNFVRKTLAYERTQHAYLDAMMFGGGYLGFYGVQEFTRPFAELIRQGSDLYGFETTGVENSGLENLRDFTVHTLYDEDWYNDNHDPGYDAETDGHIYWDWDTDGWSAHDDLLPLLNSETDDLPPQIMYLSDHGDITLGMVRLYTRDEYNGYPTLYSSLENLVNPHTYFFFYDDSCLVGSLSHDGYGLKARCFAEIITTSRHGAFACVANSRSGWGSEGNDLNSPSTHLTREFFDAVFGEGLVTLGRAHEDAKEDSLYALDEEGIRYVLYNLNLFGDPALKLRIFKEDDRNTAGGIRE